ncbi:hypothetical protein HDU93_000505 [Gonapodya sp. JEL0774]|nr:hypothetical protein HDU93_000505 [Gonapodya sp. JEL0774]
MAAIGQEGSLDRESFMAELRPTLELYISRRINELEGMLHKMDAEMARMDAEVAMNEAKFLELALGSRTSRTYLNPEPGQHPRDVCPGAPDPFLSDMNLNRDLSSVDLAPVPK